MAVCLQCGIDNPSVARFCRGCGSPLAAREEDRRPVTALYVDLIRPLDAVEELDPEVVQLRLDPYFRRLRAELERFGGTVEKFIGDPVVGLFGAPVARGDDAERAVRAAFAVLAAIDELNAEDSSRDLAVRVGVNTGEAFVELGARTSEGERMAWGDVVGTAARLQAAAPAGGVLVGEETWRATRRAIEYRDHPPVEAKAGRVPAWQAVAVATGVVAERPFVGRDGELAALETLWRQAVTEAHASSALVVGPPGIGKSRLVAELGRRVAGVCVRGRCLPYGEGMTYWPVTEILKQVAGILLSDPPETVTQKVGALLERLPTDDRDELRTMAAALSNLLGTEPTPQGTYSAREISRAELHWGLRRVLELSAQERPLLVVVEDLHWAEPTLLELLHFVGSGAAAPVLLLGSARPEPGPGMAAEVRLELGPLGADASEELLRGLLGEAPPELLERADGNPLFLEELAGAVGEEGGAALPTTLQALIGARLDALGRADKRVVQHAAVCGSVFWPGAIAELTEEQDIESSLAELERRELVREHTGSTIAGEAEWSFKHVLVRDVAYGRLPRALRARLHERFATWVAALGSAEAFVEIRAWHLEQACLLAREAPPIGEAVDALIAAGEKAEQREGIQEADGFYTRALELFDPDDPRALDLRFRRARLLTVLADHKAAVAALTPIAEEARQRGLEQVRADALVAIANVESKLGLGGDARLRLSEAAGYAERVGDERLAVQAAYELAHIRSWFDGDVDGACEVLRAAVVRADRGADYALRVEGRLRLGSILVNAARLAEAEAVLQEAAELAEQLGNVRDSARATSILGLVFFYRVGVSVAEQEFLRCADWLVRTGDVYAQIQNLRGLAKCALKRRDPELAERYLREALPLALDAGGWLTIEIYSNLVDAVLRQERLDDALGLLALARNAVPAEDRYAQAAVLVAEGLCAAAAGEDGPMVEAFTRATEALDALGLDVDAAETRLAFGRALRTTDPAAGVGQLVEARAAFARIGADAFLAPIDLELADTSA